MDILYLGITGDLAGKFVFLHQSALVDAYLKKCSGVLGNSYAPFRYVDILIAEKLEPNVLIAPEGGYHAFKKIASTMCRSKGPKAVDI